MNELFHITPEIISENFNSIRTQIIAQKKDFPDNTIAVISSGPSDGKTFIASNLALSFAQANWKTLLVDGNFRDASSADAEDVQLGLVEILLQKCSYQEAIVESSCENLFFLPRGSSCISPSNLLDYSSSQEILSQLTSLPYDIIIIDTSAYLNYPDTASILHVIQPVLICAKNNHTRRKELIQLQSSLKNNFCLGTVYID